MIRGKWAPAGLLLAIAAVAAIAFSTRDRQPVPAARSAGEKPALMLLTSLPLVFPETFTLDGGGSPALAVLERRYRVVSISVADTASLRSGPILLMAHAQAQPSEALVDLDRWVRRGGRLLLLADPALEWESSRPLGDPLRPAPMFPDTGLLRHWGLRLDAPEKRGPVQREIGGRSVLTVSPGELSGDCAISADRAVARCRIGKGRATIVADADFLNLGGADGLDGPTRDNLNALLAELAALESR